MNPVLLAQSIAALEARAVLNDFDPQKAEELFARWIATRGEESHAELIWAAKNASGLWGAWP